MLIMLPRWVRTVLTSFLGVASLAAATPALPPSAVASTAVRQALVPVPSAQAATPAASQAEPVRTVSAAASAPVASPVVASSVSRGRSAIVRATAYNSLAAQTDSTPHITATGTRTRPGVVALSRDLLRLFPYGTRIMIEDLSGRYNGVLRGRVFVVEDTMAARKTGSIDIWMASRSEALRFGARQVRITAIR